MQEYNTIIGEFLSETNRKKFKQTADKYKGVFTVKKPYCWKQFVSVFLCRFFSSVYDIFLKIIIRCFNVNISRYEYLIASKNAYPAPDKLIREFEQAGFTLLKRKDFLSGIISAQVMRKN